MRPPSSLRATPIRSVLAINRKFLGAFILGIIAWVSWPTSWQWWPLALITLITGAAAIRVTASAILLMVELYVRDRRIAAMLARGHAARPADLVDGEVLRRAGMSDD